jgi:hypothetical protein
MARRQVEATCQAALREEEERLLRLKHDAEPEVVAAKQREKEAARLVRLCRPASPPYLHSTWERAQW